MDCIDRYIFKEIEVLKKNIVAIAKTYDKRYKQTLVVMGLFGVVLLIQNSEIKELKRRILSLGNEICTLEEGMFDKTFNKGVKSDE